jgi:hypothetical protein
MLQNDMKKGQMGVLKHTGWRFEIADNMKGNIRLATVWGYEEEMGSIYTHDIAYLIMPGGRQEPLEQTPAQAKRSKAIQQSMKAMGW